MITSQTWSPGLALLFPRLTAQIELSSRGWHVAVGTPVRSEYFCFQSVDGLNNKSWQQQKWRNVTWLPLTFVLGSKGSPFANNSEKKVVESIIIIITNVIGKTLIEKRIKSNTKIEPRINNRKVNKEITHIAKQRKNVDKKKENNKNTHTQL